MVCVLRAAGARLHQLIATEVWQPMGAEFDAEITLDAHGNPMADGGISATLRDMARFGQMHLQRGHGPGGREVVPGAWVDDTIRGAADGAQAFTAAEVHPGYPPGTHYRNCWWVRDRRLPFWQASGINGQNIFIHGPSQTVVVKLSTWPTALSAASALTAEAAAAIGGALSNR